MDHEIRITAEPVDNRRCRFVVSEPLLEGGALAMGLRAVAPAAPASSADDEALYARVADHSAGTNPYVTASKK